MNEGKNFGSVYHGSFFSWIRTQSRKILYPDSYFKKDSLNVRQGFSISTRMVSKSALMGGGGSNVGTIKTMVKAI